MAQELLRVGDVATRLKLSRSLTYDLIRSGQIKSLTIHSTRRVTPEAVAAFIRDREDAARGEAE